MNEKSEALNILFNLQHDCPKNDIDLLKKIDKMIDQIKQYSEFFAVAMLKKSIYKPNCDPKTSKPTWSCIEMLQSLVKESILKERKKIWITGATDTADLECEVCGSWLTHWKKLAGKTDEEVYCCHPDHPASAKVSATTGAHVVKVPKTGSGATGLQAAGAALDGYYGCGEKFIIPVCKCHNITDSKNIEISEDLLMSAVPCTEN